MSYQNQNVQVFEGPYPFPQDDNNYCRQGEACIANWNSWKVEDAMGKASLTHLGALGGYVSPNTAQGSDRADSIYGASFKTVHDDPSYYTYYEKKTLIAPWLAQPYEQTFNNAIKKRNEPPVKTYKTLKFSPIPFQTHETFKPMTYKTVPDSKEIPCYPKDQALEHFSWDGPGYEYTGISRYIWKFILICIVFLIIYYIFKKF